MVAASRELEVTLPLRSRSWTYAHLSPKYGSGDTAALVLLLLFPGPINDYLGSCPCAEPWFGAHGPHLRK